MAPVMYFPSHSRLAKDHRHRCLLWLWEVKLLKLSNMTTEAPPFEDVCPYILLKVEIFQCHVSFVGVTQVNTSRATSESFFDLVIMQVDN